LDGLSNSAPRLKKLRDMLMKDFFHRNEEIFPDAGFHRGIFLTRARPAAGLPGALSCWHMGLPAQAIRRAIRQWHYATVRIRKKFSSELTAQSSIAW